MRSSARQKQWRSSSEATNLPTSCSFTWSLGCSTQQYAPVVAAVEVAVVVVVVMAVVLVLALILILTGTGSGGSGSGSSGSSTT